MSNVAVEFAIGADIANAGTFTVNYPTGTNRGDYEFAMGHYLMVGGTKLKQPNDITLSFGATAVTVTNGTGGVIPATSRAFFNFAKIGGAIAIAGESGTESIRAKRVSKVDLVLVNLGAPVVGDVDGLFTATSGAAGDITLNGALVSGGVATFDVPRNIIVDSGGADTAVLTFTGTDEYGDILVESITLNGTTAVAGKKAFKTVTGCTSSATISNGAFAGTGNVFGLPIHVPKTTTGYIVKELEDDAPATAGTLVAGLTRNTKSTATTADIRGTYTANSTPDGAKSFALVLLVPDPEYQGNPQYAG